MADLCYILIPRWDHRFNDEMAECVKPVSHDGPHLCLLSDGRWIEWESDHECEDCGDECECFVWAEIEKPPLAERLP